VVYYDKCKVDIVILCWSKSLCSSCARFWLNTCCAWNLKKEDPYRLKTRRIAYNCWQIGVYRHWSHLFRL